MKKNLNQMRLMIQALRDIPGNMGIYPQACISHDKEESYEQRDGWKNGWNACVTEYGKRFSEVLQQDFGKYTDDILFLSLSGAGWIKDGKFLLNMNDTFCWACADAEEVPFEELKDAVSLFSNFGYDGLIYWVAEKRGIDPSTDIPDARKAVKRIRKIMKRS